MASSSSLFLPTQQSRFPQQRFTDPLNTENQENDNEDDYDDDWGAQSYTADDIMDMEVIFGTCEAEKRVYMQCLRDAKTEKSKGWRKIVNPEWIIVRRNCQAEGKELELCSLMVEWRNKLVAKKCPTIATSYQSCMTIAQRRPNQLSTEDCVPAFTEFMTCATSAIKQREFEQNFSLN